MHQSSSPCWQSVPRTALPSGYLARASPSPPYQQCLYPRQSAFYARSTNFPLGAHLPFSPSRFFPATLGTMASADSCHLSLVLRRELRLAPRGDRSPQIRTLTFSAHLPNLRLCPLMTWTSWYLAHSSERTASYRVCVPQVAGLPGASFRPHLAVTPLPLANG